MIARFCEYFLIYLQYSKFFLFKVTSPQMMIQRANVLHFFQFLMKSSKFDQKSEHARSQLVVESCKTFIGSMMKWVLVYLETIFEII